MNDSSPSPLQESVSLITIVSIIFGLLLYVGFVNNVPLVTPALLQIAFWIYEFCPSLHMVHFAQAPYLISSAFVGFVFFLIALAFAGKLANSVGLQQTRTLERQTLRLKQNRERIKQISRNRDKHIVQ